MKMKPMNYQQPKKMITTYHRLVLIIFSLTVLAFFGLQSLIDNHKC